MKKFRMSARWFVIVLLLSFFTLQSLSIIGVISADKAFAQSIKKESDFRDKESFFVGNDDEKGNDLFERRKMVCTLNQVQLNNLKELFQVTVKTVNDEGHSTTLAYVKGNKNTKTSDIYTAIGLTKKDCKIIKRSVIFTVFLLPGVS